MALSVISRFLSSASFRTSGSWPAMQSPSSDPLYPYAYTSGRWLHRDRKQRASRYISSDFEALCKRVLALCSEATHIASYEKKEGGYNKVFVFLLNNGERIVARLPTQAAGPSRLTTNSEVATIAYVKAHTTIPLPRVLDWSDDSTNPIGSEYIIMRHVDGVPLPERWPTMSGSQYTKCVQSVCMIMNLYFDNAPFDSGFKTPFAEGFCIGPHCATSYWDCTADQRKIDISASNAGPWPDLSAYASGLVANGRSKLPALDTELVRPSYFGTVEEHRDLLRSAQDILQGLILQPQIQNTAVPTLLHADLHARNIYISNDDPTTVTCIIDWQSSSIDPSFIYATEVPDFATAPTEAYSGDTEGGVQGQESPLTEQELKLNKVASYYSQAYEICTKAFIPKMRLARAVDQLLVRPFQYFNTFWRDGAAAVRQEFLDLAGHWDEMGLTGSCPYSPTPEELKLHQKEYKAFEHVQELKLMLINLLRTDSDGWGPIDRWEEVRRAHMEIFEMALKSARDDKDKFEDDPMSEEEVRELWPFDDWKSAFTLPQKACKLP